jgi:hypothetical protein
MKINNDKEVTMIYTSNPNNLAMAFGCYGVNSHGECGFTGEAGGELYMVNCSEVLNNYTVESVDFTLEIRQIINGVVQVPYFSTTKNNVPVTMSGIYGYADGKSANIYSNAYYPESAFPFIVYTIATVKGKKVSDSVAYTKQISCIPGYETCCDDASVRLPSSGATVPAGNVNWSWYKAKFAEQYRLQIRRSSDHVVIYDVAATMLTYPHDTPDRTVNLSAGNYQWKIDSIDTQGWFAAWTGGLWYNLTVQ